MFTSVLLMYLQSLDGLNVREDNLCAKYATGSPVMLVFGLKSPMGSCEGHSVNGSGQYVDVSVPVSPPVNNLDKNNGNEPSAIQDASLPSVATLARYVKMTGAQIISPIVVTTTYATSAHTKGPNVIKRGPTPPIPAPMVITPMGLKRDVNITLNPVNVKMMTISGLMASNVR